MWRIIDDDEIKIEVPVHSETISKLISIRKKILRVIELDRKRREKMRRLKFGLQKKFKKVDQNVSELRGESDFD